MLSQIGWKGNGRDKNSVCYKMIQTEKVCILGKSAFENPDSNTDHKLWNFYVFSLKEDNEMWRWWKKVEKKAAEKE